MKILVTGGAGFIGSNLCHQLLEDGNKVIAVDNFITSSPDNIHDLQSHKSFSFYELDIISQKFLDIFWDSQEKFDQIYHLACPTGVPNCLTLGEEMLDTCSIGTKRVLQLAREHGASVVFTSTAEVYGDPEIFPQTEEYNGNVSTTGERSAYEEGKRFAESLVAMFVRKYEMNIKIARLFNAYGPGMSVNDQRVHAYNIKQALAGQPLRIYGDGSQTRTFCYVSDTVAGLMLIMAKGKTGEIYNVGSDDKISIFELAKKIITLTNSKSEIKFESHFIADHRGRLPSVKKLKALGWQRMIDLDNGMRNMIDFLKLCGKL